MLLKYVGENKLKRPFPSLHKGSQRFFGGLVKYSEKKHNVSLHNWISEKAIKPYRSHIYSHFCLLDVFTSLASACLLLHLHIPPPPLLSPPFPKPPPSESTPLSPWSPLTSTLMPLLGSIRTFYQAACGSVRRLTTELWECHTAPQDSRWPHPPPPVLVCTATAARRSTFLSRTQSALSAEHTSAAGKASSQRE